MVEVVPIDKTPEQFEFALEVKRLALGRYIVERWGWDEQLQRKNLALRWPERAPCEIIRNGQTVGILTTNAVADYIEIEDFYILPAFHRRSIGSEVLAGLLREADLKRIHLRLRCLKWNPALSLYRRHVFAVIREDDTHCYMERRSGA